MNDASVPVAGVETAADWAVPPQVRLSELARVFFIIGLTGFGGGMAIVAMIQRITVDDRRWLTDEEFAHGVAMGQFLGAFAVNTVVFVGARLRGTLGGFVAASAFLTPGVAAIIILSALYFQYRQVPALQHALHGLGPVVVALLLAASRRMAKGAACGWHETGIAAIAFVLLALLSLPVLAIIAIFVFYGVIRYRFRMSRRAG